MGGISGGTGGQGLTGGGSSSSSASILGQRAILPSLPEHRQEGLLPFISPQDTSDLASKETDFSSLGLLTRPPQPPASSSSHYSSSMATNLSLATALATPTHPASLVPSRRDPMSSVGRKGRKLFVRNLSFSTTWQALKDHLKTGSKSCDCHVFVM
jgi:hypothetical protein